MRSGRVKNCTKLTQYTTIIIRFSWVSTQNLAKSEKVGHWGLKIVTDNCAVALSLGQVKGIEGQDRNLGGINLGGEPSFIPPIFS